MILYRHQREHQTAEFKFIRKCIECNYEEWTLFICKNLGQVDMCNNVTVLLSLKYTGTQKLNKNTNKNII